MIRQAWLSLKTGRPRKGAGYRDAGGADRRRGSPGEKRSITDIAAGIAIYMGIFSNNRVRMGVIFSDLFLGISVAMNPVEMGGRHLVGVL